MTTRQSSRLLSLALLICAAAVNNAFQQPSIRTRVAFHSAATLRQTTWLYMSDTKEESEAASPSKAEIDPMAAAMETMDEESRKALEKQLKAEELRAQEVFMKKSTGKHKCTNCDWTYDQDKGDSMMIGGLVKPGTVFLDLPSNWRCPVCRASKDSFAEVVEEIPGFEVNQGYGFGTNSWSAGQKNLAIFGGLALFFILFLSGYAMS
ncbi:hypothetical protein MPSEU_000827500 [Mayamaea pseudoterrestris]|nr:hypothetical protein MPSEU_000827500 [Mayamaea pseudoterrestris]